MAKYLQSFWNHFTTTNFILELYLFWSACIILIISSLCKEQQMYKVVERKGLEESCTVDVPAELFCDWIISRLKKSWGAEGKAEHFAGLEEFFPCCSCCCWECGSSVGNMQSKMILQILRRPLTCNKMNCQENKSDSWLVRKCGPSAVSVVTNWMVSRHGKTLRA